MTVHKAWLDRTRELVGWLLALGAAALAVAVLAIGVAVARLL